jgi:Tol biopolymer transport system component
MNTESSIERIVTEALQTAAPASAPANLAAGVLDQARGVRRRPRWLAILSERPMVRPPVVLVGSPSARMATILATLLLAFVVGGLALLAGGWHSRHLAVSVPNASESPATSNDARLTSSPAPSPSEPAQAAGGLVAYTVRVQRPPNECSSHIPGLCTISQLWIANADGSNARLLPGDPGASDNVLGWSSDGSRLLLEATPGLVVSDTSGAELQSLGYDVTCPHPPKEQAGTRIDFCTSAEGFSLSPDGTHVAFVRGYGNLDGLSVVAILDLATATITELPATKATNRSERCWANQKCQGMNDTPRWSPDGRSLVFSRQTMSPEAGSRWTSAAVFTIAADGSGLRRITPAGMYAFDPTWSPDGATIAFVNTVMVVNANRTTVTDMRNDVYTIRADGTDMRRLTDDGISYGPRWTTTGRIAFARDNWNWVMDADGSNPTPLEFDLAQLTAVGCVVCRYPGPDPQVGFAWWQPIPGR